MSRILFFLCFVCAVTAGGAPHAAEPAAEAAPETAATGEAPPASGLAIHGVNLFSDLEAVRALFPDLKKTDGKDPDGDQVWDPSQGTYYTTGNGRFSHRFKNGFTTDFTSIKFLFSPEGKLLWYMAKREGYSLAADPEGKQLLNDIYRLKIALAREIGPPFADYDFMTKDNIERYDNIYACLWAMKEYQEQFRASKGAPAPAAAEAGAGETSAAAPAPTGPIVNDAQTVEQLYGIRMTPAPQTMPKPDPGMEKFKETCFYRSRTALKAPAGGFGGVVKLDIQSYDQSNAAIAVEVYSLKAYDLYNRYWARVNGLTLGK